MNESQIKVSFAGIIRTLTSVMENVKLILKWIPLNWTGIILEAGDNQATRWGVKTFSIYISSVTSSN